MYRFLDLARLSCMACLRAFLTFAAAPAAVCLAMAGCASVPATQGQFSPQSCEISGGARSLEAALHGDFRISISDSVSLGTRHPIFVHLEPVASVALDPHDPIAAQFDVLLPFAGSIIGDSLIALNTKANRPTVSVGRRRQDVLVVVDPRIPYLGEAFEFTLSRHGSLGFAGTWLRTRGGGPGFNYERDRRAFDMGPFCAKRLNAALDPDEPAVYRAALDSLLSGYQRDMPVTLSPHLLVDTGAATLAPVPVSDPAALRSFLSKRRSSAMPLETIGLARPTIILTDSARNALTLAGARMVDSALLWRPMQEAGPFWLALWREHPTAGVTQVSRVGFNAAHTEALVEVRHLCGTNCYSEEYMVLARGESGWRVSSRTLIPSRSKEGEHRHPFDYRGPNRRPDYPPGEYAKRKDAGLPRTVVIEVRDSISAKPLPDFEVRPWSAWVDFHPRLATNESGRVVLKNPPFGELHFTMSCPRFADRRGREIPSEGPLGVAFVHPGIDTLVRISVDSRVCNGNFILPRFDTTRASLGLNIVGGYPSGEASKVYNAAFEAIIDEAPDSSLLLLSETTGHACSDREDCGSLQLFRLQKKGTVQASTVSSFGKAAAVKQALDPRFWKAGRSVVMTRQQLASLKKLAASFAEEGAWEGDTANVWREVADAFPSATAIYTPTRVGFSAAGDEALIEIARSTFAHEATPELMLLRKTGDDWRVTRRHIENEKTTGRLVNGRCEPDDPSGQVPPLDSMKKVRGTYLLQDVSTHPDNAGTVDTSTLSLWGHSFKLDTRYPALSGLHYFSPPRVSRNPDSANAIRVGKSGAFPELVSGPKWMCFDCGETSFVVRSVSAGSFSGQTDPIYGIGVPVNKLGEMKYEGGFFCATRVRANPLERLRPMPAPKKPVPNVPTKAFTFQFVDSGANLVVVNVRDTVGRPLLDAQVTLTADTPVSKTMTPLQANAGSVQAVLHGVLPGTYTVRVRRIGYVPVTTTVATTAHTTIISATLRIDAPVCEFCMIVEPERKPAAAPPAKPAAKRQPKRK